MTAAFITRLEVTGGLLRLYAADAPPPAPFLLALAVSADGGTATVKALATTDLTDAQCVAVRECLKARGFHTIEWTRRHPVTGQMRRVIVPSGLSPDDPAVNTA